METEDIIRVFTERIGSVHKDVSELRHAITKMTEALTRLVVVEDRQLEDRRQSERTIRVLEKLEIRVRAVEATQAETAKTSIWVDRAVVLLVSLAIMYVARKVGLV